VLVESSEMT